MWGGSGTFQEALRPMGGWLGQRACRQLRLVGRRLSVRTAQVSGGVSAARVMGWGTQTALPVQHKVSSAVKQENNPSCYVSLKKN